MNQYNLLISAADTLFFRDGRPFTMGEDTFAESVTFPPSPSVIFGALCSAFYSENPNISQMLHIKNIWLKNSPDDSSLLPLPKDMIVPKCSKENKAKNEYKSELLHFIDSPVTSSCSESHCLVRNRDKREKVEEGNFLISSRELSQYLSTPRSKVTFNCQDLANYMVRETKLGIGRNNDTRISTDGLLYRVAMQRPENRLGRTLSIAIEANGLPRTISSEAVQLGGEKKVSWLSINDIPLSIGSPTLTSSRFKIYLSTPALFSEGWYPKTLFKSLGLTLLTAAIDKPINVGGWDVASRVPKPMVKAVPAGTVYYVEAADIESAKQAIKKIHGQSISNYEYRSKDESLILKSDLQGFGIAFIGNI